VERPEDYVWSSYRATAGLESAPAWLDTNAALSLFDGATSHYQEYVQAKLTSDECLWDSAINGIFLGSDDWAKTMRTKVESKPRSTDHPKKQRAIGRPKMPAIVAAVATAAGKSADIIRATRGCTPRMLIAWIGWHEGLVTLRTIAASLRLRSEGHISNLIRRCELAFSSDAALLAQMDGAIAELRRS
jgi:hypothetical protein